MILMTVGEYHAPNLFLVLFKVGEIGYNKVYAEHIIVGECKSAVNDENIVTALININVLAYLIHTAERHYPYRRFSAVFLVVLGKERGIFLLSCFLLVVVLA